MRVVGGVNSRCSYCGAREPVAYPPERPTMGICWKCAKEAAQVLGEIAGAAKDVQRALRADSLLTQREDALHREWLTKRGRR